MKWQVVEPTRGVFDWTGADNLVNFAEAHRERVRGHTLVWHNQMPNWLTQGVANGTIGNSQLFDLLHPKPQYTALQQTLSLPKALRTAAHRTTTTKRATAGQLEADRDRLARCCSRQTHWSVDG